MGALVARYADVGILTSDNPRSESVEGIFTVVLSGSGTFGLILESDRRTAIAAALADALSRRAYRCLYVRSWSRVHLEDPFSRLARMSLIGR